MSPTKASVDGQTMEKEIPSSILRMAICSKLVETTYRKDVRR
jgi:hypothetical protein